MRKKLFAIVMSMTMVASFMPSLAFATVATGPSDLSNTYSDDGTHNVAVTVTTEKVSWSDVENATADNSKVKEYVSVVKAPTCTEDGVVKLRCMTDNCDWSKEFKVDKTNHSSAKPTTMTPSEYVNARVAQGDLHKADAAGELASLENTYCSVVANKCSCGNVGVLVAGSSEQHERPSNLTSATCARTYKCSKCSAVVKTGSTSPHNEKAGTRKLVKAKDCGHPDVYEAECATCGETYNINVNSALGGCKYANKVTATNTKTNSTEKKYYDGTTLIATETLSSHTFNCEPGYRVDSTYDTPVFFKYDSVSKAGTCTSGAKVTFKCTVCGNVEEDTLASVGHDWVEKTLAPDCDDAGATYKECKTCGKFYVDPSNTASKVENATKTPNGVGALGHKYAVSKVNATCVTSAKYVAKCAVCGDVKEFDYNNFTTPNQSMWFNAANASLSPSKTDKYTVELPYISQNTTNNHKYSKRVTVSAATCLKEEVVGYKCDDCGKLNVHGTGAYALDTVGDKLAHKYEKIVVPATCGASGYYTEKCSVCGFVKNDEGNMVDPSTIDGTIPSKTVKKTITDKALVKDGAKCSFDKWVVTKKSTVFEKGVESLVCSVCGADGEHRTSIDKLKYAAPAVKAGKKSATVTVKATADAVSYKISYKKAGGSYKTIAAKAGKKTIKKLAKGKKYTFKVIAVNAEGVEVASATKTVKVK